jgi:hypothetical protein
VVLTSLRVQVSQRLLLEHPITLEQRSSPRRLRISWGVSAHATNCLIGWALYVRTRLPLPGFDLLKAERCVFTGGCSRRTIESGSSRQSPQASFGDIRLAVADGGTLTDWKRMHASIEVNAAKVGCRSQGVVRLSRNRSVPFWLLPITL